MCVHVCNLCCKSPGNIGSLARLEPLCKSCAYTPMAREKPKTERSQTQSRKPLLKDKGWMELQSTRFSSKVHLCPNMAVSEFLLWLRCVLWPSPLPEAAQRKESSSCSSIGRCPVKNLLLPSLSSHGDAVVLFNSSWCRFPLKIKAESFEVADGFREMTLKMLQPKYESRERCSASRFLLSPQCTWRVGCLYDDRSR